MTRTAAAIALILAATGCKRKEEPAAAAPPAEAARDGVAAATVEPPAAPKPRFTLPGLRKALATSIHGEASSTPPPAPPADLFTLVKYRAPLGENAAYVTPVAAGARRPAIVWIAGGFDWGIDAGAWEAAPRENDQSARIFSQPGIVVMRPALRGASGNPGKNECLLGEVDDVLAAVDYLAGRPDVDPARIYLGGHSTGGTMVLLAAESTDRVRAVFALGPIHDTRAYEECVPMDAPEAEWKPRAPAEFVSEIAVPTFVIEGAQGNAAVLPYLKQRAGSAPVTFVEVPGADHFTVIAPASEVIARAILADTGPAPALAIDAAAIGAALAR